MLLINLDTINEDEIKYGYMVKNKFICYSESHNWFESDEFAKLYPDVMDLFINCFYFYDQFGFCFFNCSKFSKVSQCKYVYD